MLFPIGLQWAKSRSTTGIGTRSAFHISAAGLGHLSALYFYAYAAMQIPTGILADTLGPRKLLTAGCLTAGLGTLLFALSPVFFWVGFGRLIVGGSAAAVFVGLLKLSSSWFPRNIHAFVTGNALSIGLIGAVTADSPLRFLMDIFPRRYVISVTGVLTLMLGGVIWLAVRDWPQDKGYSGFAEKIPRPALLSARAIGQGLVQVLSYRNTWLLFLIPGGIVGCILTFTGLRGVPYLISHHHISPVRAASLNSVLLISWAAGSPAFGWLFSRMHARNPLYIAGSIIVMTGWPLILFRENLLCFQLFTAFFITGFSSGCMIVSYTFVTESVPIELSGTATGLTNMGAMMGPTLLQPIVGWILDWNWSGGMLNGVRIYSPDAYEKGFLAMIAWGHYLFCSCYSPRKHIAARWLKIHSKTVKNN